ncbi:carbohydrate-binding family 9-like protein [Haliscomenobacter sp.]|uniref:carbohydrate-binding family 9-like protein n=1 Tax=Haliscomenobacter sp. TaxID=2717303 RepID=UPI003BAD1102
MLHLFLLLFFVHMYEQNTKTIQIQAGQWTALESATFFHSTDGTAADFPTSVQLKADADYLHVAFLCEKDEFVAQNTYLEHNQPLYNQEVFEVFIAPGTADPAQYIELEINPNNAIWVGKISYPSLGEKSDMKGELIDPVGSKILHQATKGQQAWSGTLSIPWNLISAEKSSQYRINFYRIVAKQKPLEKNWKCNVDNCAFLCWSPTMSGKTPAFHRPRRFGLLDILPR